MNRTGCPCSNYRLREHRQRQQHRFRQTDQWRQRFTRCCIPNSSSSSSSNDLRAHRPRRNGHRRQHPPPPPPGFIRTSHRLATLALAIWTLWELVLAAVACLPVRRYSARVVHSRLTIRWGSDQLQSFRKMMKDYSYLRFLNQASSHIKWIGSPRRPLRPDLPGWRSQHRSLK